MNTIYAMIFLLFASTHCYSQNQYLDDSLIRHYDLLNNESFPALDIEDTAGNVYNFPALTEKTIYIDFWFTTCPPCIEEIPDYKRVQQFFSKDTDVVFINICIENIERKAAWKQMIKEKQIPGVHLFYARNRPQKVNLLRKYDIVFPTYLLLGKAMQVLGYDAPRPSQKGWVEWAILNAKEGKRLSASYREMISKSAAYKTFVTTNFPRRSSF